MLKGGKETRGQVSPRLCTEDGTGPKAHWTAGRDGQPSPCAGEVEGPRGRQAVHLCHSCPPAWSPGLRASPASALCPTRTPQPRSSTQEGLGSVRHARHLGEGESDGSSSPPAGLHGPAWPVGSQPGERKTSPGADGRLGSQPDTQPHPHPHPWGRWHAPTCCCHLSAGTAGSLMAPGAPRPRPLREQA